VGVASGVVSGISFARREQKVDEWNDDSCIPQDNTSRGSNCSEKKDQANTAQTIGIVTAIVGVAFTGAGITHLLATGGSGDSASSGPVAKKKETGLAVESCGAGFLTFACRGSF
jgi:hypothetical protein